MRQHKTKIVFLLLAFVLLATAGFGCKWASKEVQEATKPVALTYWRVFDNQDSFQEIINAYRALHPNVTIEYRKFRYEEYESELLNALAEDRGPDIFSLPNTWIKKYQNKILPLPESITLPYQVTAGTIKKEVVTQLQTASSLSLRDLRNNFLDVVYNDVVILTSSGNDTPAKEKIYGLPLSMDTLALFYNRALLNNAGIPQPPQSWSEFQDQVKRLTKLDKDGNIIQSGAALGTSANVERSSDIVAILMMQDGAKMVDENGNIAFNTLPQGLTGRTANPGVEALAFYTDFANPLKEVYTWNSKMPDSLQAFMAGKTAFYFGYSYNLPVIKQGAPKLDFGVTAIPQIAGNQPVNFANYWVETVSQKTKHINEAWDFIQFATKAENAIKYLNAAGKPTALRSLISQQLNDVALNPFVAELLTAKSWYQGSDPLGMEKIFHSMIDQGLNIATLGDPNKLQDVVNNAAIEVQQTMR